MRRIISRILSVSIFITLLDRHLSTSTECRVRKSLHTDIISCECTQVRLTWIPQDLDTSCEIFDLTGTQIAFANGSSLARYKKVKRLKLENTQILEVQGNRLFQKLKYVQLINMSGSAINNIENMIWPDSVTTLDVSDTRVLSFMSKNVLLNLKIVIMKNNRLIKFPELDIRSPIEHINLDYNPLLVVDAEDIIPFCKLRLFEANLMLGPESDIPALHCKCLRVKRWLDYHNIVNNIGDCQYKTKIQCNLTYNPFVLSQHEACKTGKLFYLNDTIPVAAKTITENHQTVYLIGVGFVALVFGVVSTITIMAIINKRKSKSPPVALEIQTDEADGEFEDEGEGDGDYGELDQQGVETDGQPRPVSLKQRLPRQKLPRISQTKGIAPGQQGLPQSQSPTQIQQGVPQSQSPTQIQQEQMMPQEQQMLSPDQQTMAQETPMMPQQQIIHEQPIVQPAPEQQVMPQGVQIMPGGQTFEVPRTGAPRSPVAITQQKLEADEKVIVNVYKPVKDKYN